MRLNNWVKVGEDFAAKIAGIDTTTHAGQLEAQLVSLDHNLWALSLQITDRLPASLDLQRDILNLRTGIEHARVLRGFIQHDLTRSDNSAARSEAA